MPKQSRPVANGFAPVDFHGLQKRLLDTVPRVCMIADEAVDRALHDSHVLAYNGFPIGHAQVLVNNRGSTG
jgi:hypothetical protein